MFPDTNDKEGRGWNDPPPCAPPSASGTSKTVRSAEATKRRLNQRVPIPMGGNASNRPTMPGSNAMCVKNIY